MLRLNIFSCLPFNFIFVTEILFNCLLLKCDMNIFLVPNLYICFKLTKGITSYVHLVSSSFLIRIVFLNVATFMHVSFFQDAGEGSKCPSCRSLGGGGGAKVPFLTCSWSPVSTPLYMIRKENYFFDCEKYCPC